MNLEPPSWEPPPAPADPPPGRSRGRLRLLGVAVVIAVVGAAAGFVVTRASSITVANTTAAQPTPSGSPKHPPSFGRGGFGFPCASGFSSAASGFGGAFCGGATGTVTKISGSTLTLRTLQGTATVTTTSATTYSREGKKVSFSAIKVGEVVQVRSTHGGPASKTLTPPITAVAITIEVPTITGRVQSVSGNTITLVTSNGQLEYATTSSATVYQGIGNATATSASVKAGIYVVVQGTETDLTHITADGIQVLGSTTFTPHSFPNHPRGNASPKPSPAAGSSV